MALYKGPQPKSGININGKDALEYRPEDVRELINNDETGILRAMFQAQLMDSNDENAIAIPDNYAEHAGRPSISELPFMNSENDGMPYLKGHSPVCNGKLNYTRNIYTKEKICFCEWSCKTFKNHEQWKKTYERAPKKNI